MSKTEHYELHTYYYSDSCEMILLGDTGKELMMDIKDLFFPDSNEPELAVCKCEQFAVQYWLNHLRCV